jgi:Holliday junction resolvase RusA-like endonuclease
MGGAYVLTIDGWHPCALNRLIGCHWGTASRLKKRDRRRVGLEALAQRIPKATGKRRVRLHLVLRPRQRRCDVDAYHKSLLDALAHAGLIVDDSPAWCEIAPVTFERGEGRRAVVTLEDLPAG